jgi:PAS domain-containing protein
LDATIGLRDAEPESGVSAVPCRAPMPQLRSPTGESGLPYEWLFSESNEPVLIVDAATFSIARANPAAAAALRIPQTSLVGAPLVQAFETSSNCAIRRSMKLARASGRPDTAMVRAAADGSELSAQVSFFRAGAGAFLLFHLAAKAGDDWLGTRASAVFDAIEGSTVGFLMTDAGFRVEYANRAFMEMADLASVARIQGKSLARWLEFSESDMEQFRNQMLQCQATTLITARLRSERRWIREVEVCAVAVPDGPITCWGFMVSELPALN